MEDITDAYYKHAKKYGKTLKWNYDLYVQSDALLLADVFENIWDICIELYEFVSTQSLSAPGLVWQACLKKQK